MNQSQEKALRKFATLHGRLWKAWLRTSWKTNIYPIKAMTDDEIDDLKSLNNSEFGIIGLRKWDIKKQGRAQTDFAVTNEGTLFMFFPQSKRAKKWTDENVHLESYQWLGFRFAVEHRFAENLCEGIVSDGLSVYTE
jgi:hypothetical protein